MATFAPIGTYTPRIAKQTTYRGPRRDRWRDRADPSAGFPINQRGEHAPFSAPETIALRKCFVPCAVRSVASGPTYTEYHVPAPPPAPGGLRGRPAVDRALVNAFDTYQLTTRTTTRGIRDGGPGRGGRGAAQEKQGVSGLYGRLKIQCCRFCYRGTNHLLNLRTPRAFP